MNAKLRCAGKLKMNQMKHYLLLLGQVYFGLMSMF